MEYDMIEYDNDGSTEIPITEYEDMSTKYDPNDIVEQEPVLNEFFQIGIISKEENINIDKYIDKYKIYKVFIKQWIGSTKRFLLIPKDWHQINEENNVSEIYTINYWEEKLKEHFDKYKHDFHGFGKLSDFDVYIGWYKVIEVINE
jgi:hypothetical protein